LQYKYNTRMQRIRKRTEKPKKTVAMTFRFTDDFRRQLIAAAAQERRSQAILIETLVYAFCSSQEVTEPRSVTPGRPKRAKSTR
jgi:hypothetical protein